MSWVNPQEALALSRYRQVPQQKQCQWDERSHMRSASVGVQRKGLSVLEAELEVLG